MFEDDDYGRKVRAETRRLNGREVTLRSRSGHAYRGRLDISKYTNAASVFGEDGEQVMYYDDIAEVHEQ